MAKFTALHAAQIVEAHDVLQLLDNEEEVELLEANNPELLEAYRALAELSLKAHE